MSYPKPLEDLIAALQTLPSVGQRTAERFAFHLLRSPEPEVTNLLKTISAARAEVRHCAVCFNVTQTPICKFCADADRDKTTVCVVETPRDLEILERSGTFRGVYHVLLGRLAPVDGIHERDLTIGALVDRCRKGAVKEVVLATNPDLGGDATALAVARALASARVRVTRLARGVPAGTSLEYLGGAVIDEALAARVPIDIREKGATGEPAS